MVVPYAPGGNVDVTARVLQAAIGDALGQPVVIENRPGGAGLIGGDYVARAEPDGHTLLVGSNGPVILGPLTMAKPAYQWEQAFAPVSSLAVATNLLLVRPALPAASVQELVDHARRNPNKLTLATSSVASINHFLAELFRLKAGITWTEVHYRGNALAINDLIAGHVDVGFQQLVDAAQHLKSGKLRALAVPGKVRAAALPDVAARRSRRRRPSSSSPRWARRRAAARRRSSPHFCATKPSAGATSCAPPTSSHPSRGRAPE
jgi:tripartite-type tricarboxylate transporter receptor subunit TctC